MQEGGTLSGIVKSIQSTPVEEWWWRCLCLYFIDVILRFSFISEISGCTTPCLSGLLKDVYLDHAFIMTQILHIILSDNIFPCDLEALQGYCELFQQRAHKLYPPYFEKLNLHYLQHLPSHIKYWGPAWVFSMFPIWRWECQNQEIGERAQCTHLINCAAVQPHTRQALL